MSSDAFKWAKAQRTGSAGTKAVLLVLAEFADEQHSCFPGQALLASVTEQGERTVRRQLAQLQDKGLITREARMREDGRGRTSDRYYLAVPPDQPATTNRPSATTNRPLTTVGDDQPAIDDRPTGQSLAGEIPGINQKKISLQRSPGETRTDEELMVASFNAFWKWYPRKTAKGKARQVWPAAVRAVNGDLNKLVGAVRRYAEDPNLPEKQFIPHPNKWLTDERWDDEPLPTRVANGRPAPKGDQMFQTVNEEGYEVGG